ncbi:TVP38/TMEM64 family protein [Shivajiella indica]|uniref:TVP38/TMEM64 family protein n=1 Tax=Shivajiella indica TaxID=872115 RepID=A0ABW5B9Y7_9BACT
MEKKLSIFKEFRESGRNNPKIAFAFLWVSLMPSLGSLIIVPWTLHQSKWISSLDFSIPSAPIAALTISILLMGLAIMPTTLIAGLTGFLLGWKAFPWLVLGYSLATLLGYAWGKGLSGKSLDFLLIKYPRVEKLLDEKKENLGELIFFVRLSPVIPFALSNLFFALLNSGWKKLILFGTLGMLPRTTLVFFSGTLVSDLYSAVKAEGISGKGWIFLCFLLISIWGIFRFFKSKKP